MRRIRYQVACSLDGYITGPDGDIDWIVEESKIDFAEVFAQFDTLVMGRVTYEELAARADGFFGKQVLVASRTLRQEDHPDVTILADDLAPRLEAMRAQPGKDIWLFGGGSLFRSVLELGLVDTVEPAVMPVLVGGGTPMLPVPAAQTKLRLTGQRTYPSGIVWLEYEVDRSDP